MGLSSFSNWKGCSAGQRSGNWLGHWRTFNFFCIRKDLSCFHSMYRVFWLNGNSVAPTLLITHLATSLSSHIIDNLDLAIHVHAKTLPPPSLTYDVVYCRAVCETWLHFYHGLFVQLFYSPWFQQRPKQSLGKLQKSAGQPAGWLGSRLFLLLPRQATNELEAVHRLAEIADAYNSVLSSNTSRPARS